MVLVVSLSFCTKKSEFGGELCIRAGIMMRVSRLVDTSVWKVTSGPPAKIDALEMARIRLPPNVVGDVNWLVETKTASLLNPILGKSASAVPPWLTEVICSMMVQLAELKSVGFDWLETAKSSTV